MSQKRAKKQRRDQRLRQEQEDLIYQEPPSVLETLLEKGDVKEYAQACWSLANNEENTPTAGDLVTLSGPCEEHGAHEQGFIITPQTLMAMAQCSTVGTCGEAIRLIAKKVPPEKLPCYQFGHQEQAFDQMMFGKEPQECLYCGEISEFIMPSKSIDWPDDIPAKGIDGEEYRTCPKCNSDFLEIQGEKLGQWGWNIACLHCGWKIKQAELLDIDQYRQQLKAIKAEMQGLRAQWDNQTIKSRELIEAAGVATRKLVERIAFATLIANKDNSGGSPEDMSRWWNPREILNRIEKINPDCFPKPIEIADSCENGIQLFKGRTEDVLNKEQVIEIYRNLNPLAHSANPLTDEPDYERYEALIPGWLDWIENTLEIHQIKLFHHPNHIYVAKMSSGKDNTVDCTAFTLNEEALPTCAWPECVASNNRTICQFWNKPWSDCPMPEKEEGQTQGKAMGALIDREEAQERAQYLF